MHDALVSTISLRPLLVELQRRGLDPDAVLGPHGIAAADITEPLQRVPESVLWEVWAEAVRVSGDLALGIRVGCHFEPQSLGILGHIISNSATLADALEHWRRFASLIDDKPLFQLHRSGEQMRLELRRRPDIDPRENRSLVEFAVFSILKLLGTLSGAPGLPHARLHRLEFRHPQPEASVCAVYEEVLPGVEMRFAQSANALIGHAADLDRSVAYADPQMLQLLATRAQQQMRDLHRGDFVVLRVRQAIRRRLEESAPTIVDIAADCATSRSTLQRQLKAAGLSFRAVLAEVRRERAFELLRDGQRQVDEVAALLAYSEPAAFIHAFRRWTGMTPRAWREAQTDAPTSA